MRSCPAYWIDWWALAGFLDQSAWLEEGEPCHFRNRVAELKWSVNPNKLKVQRDMDRGEEQQRGDAAGPSGAGHMVREARRVRLYRPRKPLGRYLEPTMQL